MPMLNHQIRRVAASGKAESEFEKYLLALGWSLAFKFEFGTEYVHQNPSRYAFSRFISLMQRSHSFLKLGSNAAFAASCGEILASASNIRIDSFPATSTMLSWDKISRKDEKRRKNKADALCAFRTITTMLSSIQSIRDTTDNVSNAKSDDKPALTVLDAFAALTIRNHGIVALTSMPYDRSTSFQVLASAYLKGEVLNSAQLPATVHQVKKFWLRNLFMAQNPRDASVKLTTVVDPEIKVPQHLKDAVSGGSELLTSFLTHEWWAPFDNLILVCLSCITGPHSRTKSRNLLRSTYGW